MDIKKITILILVFLGMNILKSQTYYITNTGSGSAGCADVVLGQAIAAANLGGNVTVNMNASGYCNYSNVPIINHTAGTITIQRDPAAMVNQGFAGATPYSSLGGAILTVISNTVASFVVKNIDLVNDNIGLVIVGCNTVTVDGVRFISNLYGLIFFDGNGIGYPDCTVDALVQNCEFDNTATCSSCLSGVTVKGISRDNMTTSLGAKKLKILSNTFKTYNPGFFNVTMDLRTRADYDNLEIQVKNNTYVSTYPPFSRIGNGDSQVYWGGNSITNNTYDYLFTLFYENNSLGNLELVSPLNQWKIANNVFAEFDISNPTTVTRNYKVGLIDPSDSYCLNQSFLNNTNTFVTGANLSLGIGGNLGPGCALTEMTDLNLVCAVALWDNVSLRKCRVPSNLFPGFPIIANNGIYSTLFPTVVNSGQLTAYFTYSGIVPSDNNDLYFDFYKSNANGDLLDYIGTKFVAAANINGYDNVTLPVPGGVTLTQSDRIAMTITGLHVSGSTTVVAKGTGQAFYPVPTCTSVGITAPTIACVGPVALSAQAVCAHPLTFMWNYGDGTFGSGLNNSHNYSSPGIYNVGVTVTAPWLSSPLTSTINITVNACQPPQTCQNCIGSLAPDPGDYLISVWVREDVSPLPTTYSNPKLNISFTGDPMVYTFGTDVNKSKLIEGWQKIEESFTVPNGATYVNIDLVNTGGSTDVYFDDIRLIPKNAQMKSYVYDPITLKLSAVLDENNYATLYEYDEEGKLLRVKKETEKGIMTIQENKESLKSK